MRLGPDRERPKSSPDNSLDSYPVHTTVDGNAPDKDRLSLGSVSKGRMFCTAHGRQCYQKPGFYDGTVWVCPDERHAQPIE